MNKITLLPNPYRDRGFQITRSAERILTEHGAQVQICLPFHVDRNYELPSDIHFAGLEEGLTDCEALVCFGGDGTILHAARLVGNRDIALLGVNTGTMGFLAELESDELELLPALIDGNFTEEERMLLKVKVRRGERTIFEDHALNDAVITKGAVARVLQTTVFCDGQEAMRFDGDGLILCTPTGTTAYSMSAGGPIVEPYARNIIVTPICAHTINSRSLVVSHERTVSARIGRIGRRNAYLSVDGGRAFRLSADDEVVVTGAKRTVRLLKVKNISFYGVLNHKFQG
ncbi:MAG: NAD(+)/NADH kinase [Oscillospiraceae bacterium]|nr:NAD(+)/NADH kinase [Oscillospiraceae bacterium]